MTAWTPTSWVTAVLQDAGLPVTQNNIDNMLHWLPAENYRDTWFNRNNPLNTSLGTNSTDGFGSYPNLGVAAQETANMIMGRNGSLITPQIRDALAANAPLAQFSAAVVASNWTGDNHYGGRGPGYIASLPIGANVPAPASAGSVEDSPTTTTTPTPVAGGPTEANPTAGSGTTYTVVSGDTLNGIAASHNVSLSSLEAANPQITDPDLIFPGEAVNIPGEPSESTPSSGGSSSGVASGVGIGVAGGIGGGVAGGIGGLLGGIIAIIDKIFGIGSGDRIAVDVEANLGMAQTMRSIANELSDVRLRLLRVPSSVSAPPPAVSGLVSELESALAQLAPVIEAIDTEAQQVTQNAQGLQAEESEATKYVSLGTAWPDLIWATEFAGTLPAILAPVFEAVDAAEAAMVPVESSSFPTAPTVSAPVSAPVDVPTSPPTVSSAPVTVSQPTGGAIDVTSVAAAGVTVGAEMAVMARQQITWYGSREGSVLLSGSSWLGGKGIPVYSDNGTDYGGSYQCVDLVTNLFRDRGWIKGSWWGNGGGSDSLFYHLPAGVTGEAQGHITKLVPGDAVCMNVLNHGVADEYGHVVVVNQIVKCSNGYMVQFVNQNSPTVYTYGTLSPNGVLTMNAAGSQTYGIIGVCHAVANPG